MAKSKVMIEEYSENLFIINDSSSFVKMIEFGYILHSFLVDSEIVKENDWFDYMFSLSLKIIENEEGFTIIDDSDLDKILKWLDWICQILVTSEGKHNENVFVKEFLCQSDNVFKKFNKQSEKLILKKEKSSN
jgi:hypothetical protein